MAGSPQAQAQFHTTHWSVVLAAGQDSSPAARDALDRLCRTYWYPLYAYVRRSGRGAHEAEDLTQEFFARLLRKDFPTGIKPEGGKFRSYLLAALKNFLVNEWTSSQTVKRGSGKTILSREDLGARGAVPIGAFRSGDAGSGRWASRSHSANI